MYKIEYSGQYQDVASTGGASEANCRLWEPEWDQPTTRSLFISFLNYLSQPNQSFV